MTLNDNNYGQLPNNEDPPLYDVWGSSYKAMDEFGIGVGLYYRQLLLFAIVSFLTASESNRPLVHEIGRAHV